MTTVKQRWVFIGVFAIPILLSSQDIRIELPSGEAGGDSGYSSRWDSVQDRLIVYRGEVKVPSLPAARVFRHDGSSVPFYPFKDFPEARQMTIWGAATTPEGGLVLSVIAEYGPRDIRPVPVKSLVLTYDNSARLKRVWEVKPYHHHQIAVDREGNIFGLGDRGDLKSDYPLLIKYSPTGKILREMLPSSLFPVIGDNVVLSGSRNGESEMFIENEQLYLWLAPGQELFRFSLTGELLARVSMAGALRNIAVQTGYDRTEVMWLGVQNGKLVAQIRLWPKDVTRQHVKVGMVVLAEAGAEATLLAPLSDGPSPGHFLGTASDQRLLFVELDGKTAVVRRY